MVFLKKILPVIIFFIVAPLTLPAQVTLSGNAPSYAGQELVFFKYADYVTQTEEVIARCNVDEDGNFTCNLKVDEITYVFNHLGIYRVYLFVEPQKSYQLVLPEHEPKTEQQRLNPYFREVDLHVGIANMKPNDLNYLISTFDLLFNQHFDDIVKDAYSGNPTLPIDSLTAKMEGMFSQFNNPFFDSYRNYRYGLLSQIALMQQSRSISSNYFENRPILYNNPAYMELFNLLFDKYFLFFARSDSGNSDIDRATNSRSYSQLKSTLAQDDVLANDTLLELVILKGLHDGFFDDRFSRGGLLAILDSLYSQSLIPEHLLIAENIRTKVTRLLPGFVPAPFELYTIDGKLVKLNDFEGKYVYLNFCSTTSYTCLQEFPLLETIYEKYKKHLEIVTIAVDQEIDDLKLFLDQTNYEWTFLHYGNKPDIVRDFDIRAFPTYFLIGPDRRLIISPAPSPKENFEQQFFNMLRSRGKL
ncbi:MAG: TlpA disulfide reductase family protein [Bacteroidales bacterium]|nr:TlpA disulfide reductase family protein [Bacteroidales bacterium]MDY0253890.1 TlpA disulfide reductase family protein [Tenuifilaceae bacterium]